MPNFGKKKILDERFSSGNLAERADSSLISVDGPMPDLISHGKGYGEWLS